jgi:hypothetical protein
MMTKRACRRTLWGGWSVLINLAIVVMAGCSHKEVAIYQSPDVAVRPTASYAIVPTLLAPTPVERDPRVHNALVHERIRAAITVTLEAKGYRQSSPNTAEFLVHYRVSVRTTEREIGGFVSRNNPAGPSSSGPAAILTVARVETTEGKLVIELVDRQSGAIVYRAEAHDDDVTLWDDPDWVVASAVRLLLQDL